MAAPMAGPMDEGHLSAVENMFGERSTITSRRSSNWGLGPDNVFARLSDARQENELDDEEALKWAALEKLPTYSRLHTTMLEQMMGSKIRREPVDVRNIGPEQRQDLLRRVFNVSAEEDNLKFIQKYRERLDRADIRQPTVEVRFENISVEANCYVGGRSLPTLYNSARNNIEIFLSSLGIPVTKKTKVSILDGVSGIIKPGRMTLLLGPPASGKTTLLLALTGKLDSDLKVQGKVTYNGHTLDEFVPQRTAAYISQHDLHQGELTVRETLDFSAKCQGVGQRQNLLKELVKREKERGIRPEADVDFFMKGAAQQEGASDFITEYIFKILGLDICADTIVGDAMRRGISGGQKKRVTTGEMVVGPTRTLFMDEISTGLDTSTTFQIVKCLSDIVHVLECTVVISLLQPAPETYDLFDDVIILSEGQVVYHGPVESVLDFFGTCGFKCPPRKGTADFLQEVTSRKDQQQYWADTDKQYEYVPVKVFVDAFKKYHLGTKTEEELAIPFDKSTSHPAALVFEKFAVPTKQVFKAVFQRELLLMKRNSFIYVFKSTQISILALISMSVFFRTTMHRRTLGDAQVFAGALFYGVVNIMFNGAAELSMTITRLPVFYRQRDLLFFPAWTFSVSTLILRTPISMLESLVWICLTYYTIGFAPAAGRFFRQLLLYFWVHQMSSGLFRLIAGVCRTMIITQTGGSFALLIMFALGGFLIPRTSIKPWWIWGYWISPLAYAQNGIDINEFIAPQWNTDPDARGRSLGIRFLEGSGLFTRGYWYWLCVGVMIGYSFLFNFLFTLAITYLNPLGKSKSMISKEMLAEQQGNLTGETVPSLSRKSFSRSARGSGLGLRERITSLSRKSVEGEGSGQDVKMSRLSTSSVGGRDSLESVDNSRRQAPKGMILPFQPLSISFDNVNYSVDMPSEAKRQGEEVPDKLQLLRGVTGAFRPGVLTALVGVSGAGKSTLMDVLAGRKTGGYIEGDIRISGFPKNQATFARISGYCEQNDIHSPQVTVYESLIYSAWLRLSPDSDDITKREFVEQVMELVELLPLRDAIVGLPGVTGLSTEQRKRLTIAVELVANPSIIFMDEPTSGLDARAAAIVMRTVRNTVDTGRTVVCTIHQPSIDIFEAFDELLLMKRGGQVIYAGPLGRHSRHLVEYFQAFPGVPHIKEGYNPATWMLEVSSVAVEQRLGVDFGDLYLNSDLFQRNKDLVKELSTPPPNAKDLWFATQYAQPFWSQFSSCMWKQNLTYWRSPEYNLARLVFTVVSAILFGTIFWRLGPKRNTQSNIFSVMGAMYGATLFIGTNNSSSVQPVVATERTVFYREKAAGMFSPIPYAMAQVLVEVPYIFVQVMLYALITYSMIGLEWTAPKFFWYVFFMFCTFLLFTFYGMMAVGLTPNHQIAAIVAAFFYSLFNLFAGFLVTRKRLPKWWVWYYWICPVAWTLYGLIASQFGDVESDVTQADGTTVPVKQFVKDYFGFEHSFLWMVALVMVIFPVLFASLFMFSIKYLNYQKR